MYGNLRPQCLLNGWEHEKLEDTIALDFTEEDQLNLARRMCLIYVLCLVFIWGG